MKVTLITLFLLTVSVGVAFAAPQQEDIFTETSPVKISVMTDIDGLLSNRVDPKYQGAVVSVLGDDWIIGGDTEIKMAGNSRRELCDLPPMKIKLEGFDQPWSNKIDKLKIVLSCRADEQSEEMVIKEYLSYKLYNIISPESYHVRLVEVTFTEPTGEIYDQVTGFILEQDDHLEKRISVEEMKKKNLNTAGLIHAFYRNHQEEQIEQFNLVSVFQYMIGNTDWSIHTRHNIKIFEKEGYLVPVPYDFDYSGLVNAPYAKPCQNAPIENVTDRFYQGQCMTVTDLQGTIDIFNEKEEALFALINGSPLTNAQKNKCRSYLKQFYRTINDDKKLSQQLEKTCTVYGGISELQG